MEGFDYLEALSTQVIDDSPDGGEGEDTARGAVKFDSTGDKFAFRTSFPVDIVRWGFIASDLVDVGVRLTIRADFRPVIGEDDNRVSGEAAGGAGVIDLGTSAVPAHTTGDVAPGNGVFTDVVSSAGLLSLTDASLNTKSQAPFELDPGEELMFEVTDAADTDGAGYIFVHYVPRGFHTNDLNPTKTVTAAGTDTTGAQRAAKVNKVANVA